MGSATCRALAAQGARIAAADIDLDKAKRTVGALSGQGHAAFHVDVTDEASIVRLFAAVEETLGPVAVLVCIAGGRLATGGPGSGPPIVDMTLEHWRNEVLNQVVFLRARCCGVAPRFHADGARQHGWSPGCAPTSRLSRSRRGEGGHRRLELHGGEEAAPLGITVNAVAPGLIDAAVRANTTAEMRENHNKRHPFGRMGRDEEVAAAIVFLASREASYITGVTLTVNGGIMMP
jgi:3-oxoacyl-[acyl-carrier protein] reductase